MIFFNITDCVGRKITDELCTFTTLGRRTLTIYQNISTPEHINNTFYRFTSLYLHALAQLRVFTWAKQTAKATTLTAVTRSHFLMCHCFSPCVWLFFFPFCEFLSCLVAEVGKHIACSRTVCGNLRGFALTAYWVLRADSKPISCRNVVAIGSSAVSAIRTMHSSQRLYSVSCNRT